MKKKPELVGQAYVRIGFANPDGVRCLGQAIDGLDEILAGEPDEYLTIRRSILLKLKRLLDEAARDLDVPPQ